MRIIQRCASSALVAGLVLVSRMASAQVGPSDTMTETITDMGTGLPVPIVFGPPPVVVSILEGSAEPVVAMTMPARQFDFIEGFGPNQGHLSDRLTISPYDIRIQSDSDPGGLPPGGPGVIRIPAAANETFQPIRIEAFSDGEQPNGTASDLLTITLGYYGPGTGSVVFSGVIPEAPEGTPEPPLTFTIPLTLFDIEEPLAETGGVPGVISDYFDILSEVQVQFISSDDLQTSPVTNGFVTELTTGGGVLYAINFTSDAVPEPTSLGLLSVALLAAGMFVHRRVN